MIDILLTEDNDIDLTGGDIALTEPTGQHKRDILLASQGDYKEAPLMGVGLIEHLNAESDGSPLREVAEAMRRDGITIKKVAFDPDGQLIIDGEYEDNNHRT